MTKPKCCGEPPPPLHRMPSGRPMMKGVPLLFRLGPVGSLQTETLIAPHKAVRVPLRLKVAQMIVWILLGVSTFITAFGHNGPLIIVPVGGTPTFDATCTGFNDAARFKIADVDGFGVVAIKRDGDALWICVAGVVAGSPLQRVSVYLDLDHTGPVKPQSSQIVLTVSREGKFASFAGNGGGYSPANITGWSAKTVTIPAEFSVWNAQFQIESPTLRGWNHAVGIAVESRDEGNPVHPALWPKDAVDNRPDTWADLLLSGASWQGPPGGCIPDAGLPFVFATAITDLGLAKPDALVDGGTQVCLSGTAKILSFASECGTIFQDLPFAWSMTFQSTGGLPEDATALLQNANTLSPCFLSAPGPGTYVGTLHAGKWSGSVRIQVLRQGGGWYSIGPDMGRVNSLAFDPVRPNTMYAAAALGGVWKSVDRGNTWFPMSDQKGLPTLGAGPLAIDGDGTIYVGTGDLYPNNDGLWQGGADRE